MKSAMVFPDGEWKGPSSRWPCLDWQAFRKKEYVHLQLKEKDACFACRVFAFL
jgi:hypothetical protein